MKKSIILLVLIVAVSIVWQSPYMFVEDGFLTKTKVDEFDSEYNYTDANRHYQFYRNVYIISFGTEKPTIHEEYDGKAKKDDIKITRLLPFLYKWKVPEKTSGIYRVGIGERKYYFLYVVN